MSLLIRLMRLFDCLTFLLLSWYGALDYRIVFAWGLTPLRRKMMVNFIRSIHVTSVLAHRFCMGLTPLRRNMMIKIDGTLILASRAWFSGAMVIFSGFVHGVVTSPFALSQRCAFLHGANAFTPEHDGEFHGFNFRSAHVLYYISGVICGLLTSSLTIVITNLLLMVKSIFIQTFRTNWCDLAPFVCVTIYRLLLRNMMVNLMGLMHGTFWFARLTCCCFRTCTFMVYPRCLLRSL